MIPRNQYNIGQDNISRFIDEYVRGAILAKCTEGNVPIFSENQIVPLVEIHTTSENQTIPILWKKNSPNDYFDCLPNDNDSIFGFFYIRREIGIAGSNPYRVVLNFVCYINQQKIGNNQNNINLYYAEKVLDVLRNYINQPNDLQNKRTLYINTRDVFADFTEIELLAPMVAFRIEFEIIINKFNNANT